MKLKVPVSDGIMTDIQSKEGRHRADISVRYLEEKVVKVQTITIVCHVAAER